MKSVEYSVSDITETNKIASRLASTLNGGEFIIATGDLGVGKTAFCKALGASLGVKRIINSPTFNLIKVYEGKYTLYHVDCYRLENCDEEKKDLGLNEIIGDKNNIVYMEWPEFASEEIKNYHPKIEINISYINDNERRIVIKDERQ